MPYLIESNNGVDLFKAAEGDTFSMTHGPNDHAVEYVVRPACAETGSGGQWICTTHRQVFRVQFEKDHHISQRGTHVLAWICLEHGPEVP